MGSILMDGGGTNMFKTVMLGADKVFDTSGVMPMPAKDSKGRQLWRLPKPIKYVDHFKNAASKRKHLAGELSLPESIMSVPIYRGLDSRVYNMMKQRHKRESKNER
jgi:hypothetical protein